MNSPDTLTGAIKATSNLGIDSVWIYVGTKDTGRADGGFQFEFQAPLFFFIDSLIAKNTRVPVQLRARDIAGYEDVLDTFVVIK